LVFAIFFVPELGFGIEFFYSFKQLGNQATNKMYKLGSVK